MTRTPEESLSGAIAIGLLPIVCFCVVMFTGVADDPTVAMVVVPGVAAAVAAVLARALGTRSGWIFVCGAGSFLASFAASGTAWLLALFGSIFSTF